MRADELLRLLRRVNALRHGPCPTEAAAWLREAERDLAGVHGADRHLAVYGTLAPGGCNHHLVAGFGGSWEPVEVAGHRSHREWPVFTWRIDAAPVAMQLLVTPSPIAWPELDAFEGPGYRRILVVARTRAGIAVANLYEAAVPVDPP